MKLEKFFQTRVGNGGGDDGRIFPGHPSPILHAPRDIISRKGKSLTPIIVFCMYYVATYCGDRGLISSYILRWKHNAHLLLRAYLFGEGGVQSLDVARMPRGCTATLMYLDGDEALAISL